MRDKKIWIIAIGALVIVAIAGMVLLTGTLVAASEAVDFNYLAFIPLVLNQPQALVEPAGELIFFTPVWEMGASSDDPTVGEGSLEGWYVKEEYTNGTKINLGIYIYVRHGYPGFGTGTYEIYLPNHLEPASDWFVGHANMWIGGGGMSEYDGSMKWTMRNTAKGPKLIFTFDGSEWSPTHPKNFTDLKLRANIEYWLQSVSPTSELLETLE